MKQKRGYVGGIGRRRNDYKHDVCIDNAVAFQRKQKCIVGSTVNGSIRDVREQQIRAMQGSVVTLGSVVDYSIRFEQDRIHPVSGHGI